MKTLITGSDGSLGVALCKEHDYRFNSFCMGRSVSARQDRIQMMKGTHTKAAIEECLERSMSLTRHLDYAILNDGINHLSWIGLTPEEDEAILQRNVMAPYWTLNALADMRDYKPMRVVFVTSQTYRVPQRTTALYCASKAALTMLMRVAARELAPRGWIINAVAPGKIQGTEMSRLTDQQVMDLRGWSEAEMNEYATKLVPMGRFTNATEVAKIIFDTLAMLPYVNGTVIDACGGV